MVTQQLLQLGFSDVADHTGQVCHTGCALHLMFLDWQYASIPWHF